VSGLKKSFSSRARRKWRMTIRARSKRRTARSGSEVVHFLHIGKTGGTAVKSALRSAQSSDGYVFVLHSHKARLRDVPTGERVVFFLRDPITRYISSFYSRQRQGLPRHLNPWNREEEVAFSRFTSPNELAAGLSAEDDDERELARHAMRAIKHVKSSYWDWFENESYFLSRIPDILFVGFQESLDADFERLKQKLGLADAVTLPEGEIEAHKNPTDIDRSLDEVARRNLHEWYAPDYQFLRLCQERASQINGVGPFRV
jgi:hypothetical protein